MSDLQDDLKLALDAALAGGAVASRFFETVGELAQEHKSDGSVVTAADRATETEIKRVLLARRPGDAFLGEETGTSGAGPRRWILDGIDGTALFVEGDPRWQSLIALEIDGEVMVGVSILPSLRQIWWAARGAGAFTAPLTDQGVGPARRLVAGGRTALEGARWSALPSADYAGPDGRRRLEGLSKVAPLDEHWPVHVALMVAAGELDIGVQLGGEVWDHAAPGLIVQEAGGAFSDIQGKPHPTRGWAVFAASEALRQKTVAAIPD